MARSSEFSDKLKTCNRNHCASRTRHCVRSTCREALAEKLHDRQVKHTTRENVLDDVLSNIRYIKQDIRNKCDRAALNSRDILQAAARFSSATKESTFRPWCSCKACQIDFEDRKIALLKFQHTEAKKWLEVLRKYRRRYDLDAISVALNVAR